MSQRKAKQAEEPTQYPKINFYTISTQKELTIYEHNKADTKWRQQKLFNIPLMPKQSEHFGT
jgi:hypothetical protein